MTKEDFFMKIIFKRYMDDCYYASEEEKTKQILTDPFGNKLQILEDGFVNFKGDLSND